jgi:hypothetical protein
MFSIRHEDYRRDLRGVLLRRFAVRKWAESIADEFDMDLEDVENDIYDLVDELA